MVENAYQITLVSAFIPLLAGVYWQRATNQGALAAIFCGVTVWLVVLLLGGDDPFIPAQFAGLMASICGMVVGSLLPQQLRSTLPQEPEHAYLHHHAASQTEHIAAHLHQANIPRE
jgi:Na+/proline symporter